MKTIEFYVIDNGEDTSFVLDKKIMTQNSVGAEDLKEAYGDRLKEHEVVFKRSSYGMAREINSKAQVGDDVKGFKIDYRLIPGAQAEVVVDHWTLDAEVSVEGFDSLEEPISQYIAGCLNLYLYPDASRDPLFLKMWTDKHPVSQE